MEPILTPSLKQRDGAKFSHYFYKTSLCLFDVIGNYFVFIREPVQGQRQITQSENVCWHIVGRAKVLAAYCRIVCFCKNDHIFGPDKNI